MDFKKGRLHNGEHFVYRASHPFVGLMPLMAQCVWLAWMSHIRPYLPTMTSSHGNTFRVTRPLWRESIGQRWIPSGPVALSLDVFFVVRPNTRLNKQRSWRWFETPWRLCYVTEPIWTWSKMRCNDAYMRHPTEMDPKANQEDWLLAIHNWIALIGFYS